MEVPAMTLIAIESRVGAAQGRICTLPRPKDATVRDDALPVKICLGF
jgi:hypothetical protein